MRLLKFIVLNLKDRISRTRLPLKNQAGAEELACIPGPEWFEPNDLLPNECYSQRNQPNEKCICIT